MSHAYLGSGSGGKKCSLTVATADITIDMAAVGEAKSPQVIGGKSPMQKLARLAKMARKEDQNSRGTGLLCGR